MPSTPSAGTNLPKVSLEYLPPDVLDFDIDNPRFIDGSKVKTQDSAQKILFEEPYFAAQLVDSFVENGYIDLEPLVAKKNGDRYIIIEGNRRLCAIRHIKSNQKLLQSLDTDQKKRIDDLKSIPVLVVPKSATQEEESLLRVYLGVRHLQGFRDWPMLSKAQYLEKFSATKGGLSRILAETGLTKSAVRRFLVPWRLLKKAKEKIPEGEDFSNLSEAIGRAGTAAYIELEIDSTTLDVLSFDKKKFEQLLDDLYGRKGTAGARNTKTKVITDTRDISAYSKVLASSKARQVLHSGKSLQEAEIYVDNTDQSVKRLLSLTNQVGALLNKLSTKSPNDKKIKESFKDFEKRIKAHVVFLKSLH